MESFYKLLDMALSDGILTPKERELLLIKAKELNMDEIEAEMLIESKLSAIQTQEKNTENKSDGFLISDEELILRTTKWVNRISEKSLKIEVERFPKIEGDSNKYQNYLDQGSDVLKKLNSSGMITSVAGLVPGVGSVVKAGLKLSGAQGPENLNNNQIREIADNYLLILELRAKNNETIANKYGSLLEKYKEQVSLFEKNNKKGFRGLFS